MGVYSFVIGLFVGIVIGFGLAHVLGSFEKAAIVSKPPGN